MSAADEERPLLENELPIRSPVISHDEGINQMLLKGWCIHQARHLAKTCPAELFAHFTTIQRFSRGSQDHARCADQDWCIAYDVDLNHYKTQHVEHTCSCSMIHVPYDDLTHVINQGKVPLISIQEGKDPEIPLSFDVQERTGWSTYTALSHVWADGLGNPRENAIPECQARRILRALKQLDRRSKPLFWFDTLCIPVKSADSNLRQRTIHRMGGIYYFASTVLVLDAELMSLREHDAPSGFLARILCSTWMSRSWTLQEGLLSLRCAFQIGNKVYAITRSSTVRSLIPFRESESLKLVRTRKTSWRNQQSSALIDVDRQAAEELMDSFRAQPWGKYSMSYDREDRFRFVWNALATRSTTKSDDLPIVIANVLGLSWQHVQSSGTPSERLENILLTLNRIPQSLLFNKGPRETTRSRNNCQWMPSSPSRKLLRKEFMSRSNGLYKLSLSRINDLKPGLSMFFTKQYIIPSRRHYTISLHGEIYTVEVHLPIPRTEAYCRSEKELDAQNFAYTVVAIEDGTQIISGERSPVPAAILYGQSYDHGSTLHYHCPASLIKTDTDRTIESTTLPDYCFSQEGSDASLYLPAGEWHIFYMATILQRCHQEARTYDLTEEPSPIPFSSDCVDADHPFLKNFHFIVDNIIAWTLRLTPIMMTILWFASFPLAPSSDGTHDSWISTVGFALSFILFGPYTSSAVGISVFMNIREQRHRIRNSMPTFQRRVHAIFNMRNVETMGP